MFTSRAEHRLLFNHGSAELRLFEHSKSHKLLSDNRIGKILHKLNRVHYWQNYLENTRSGAGIWAEGIRRDKEIAKLPSELAAETAEIREEVLYRVIYAGYLERELRQVEKLKHVEKIRIPLAMDYAAIPGMRRESALKLAQFRPQNLGQASRISGVNPADISILMIQIAAQRRATEAS
jgi:tRNA uridine 5-carboxymethylaminomethyl modification enzyme